MTEKRFNIEYVQGNPTIFHIVDDGKHIDEMKIVDLLNGYYESNKNLYNNYMRLMEENEQLKSDNKCYVKRYSELFDDYIAYKKENEQLKHDATVLIQANQDYRKENEQLKSENQELKQYLSWQDMELEEMEDLND